MVDITFQLILHFSWHFISVDTTFRLTLHFGWHYIFVDTTFWLTLQFGWHYILVDITFWLKFHFGWHYILIDKRPDLIFLKHSFRKVNQLTGKIRTHIINIFLHGELHTSTNFQFPTGFILLRVPYACLIDFFTQG